MTVESKVVSEVVQAHVAIRHTLTGVKLSFDVTIHIDRRLKPTLEAWGYSTLKRG